MGPTQTRRSISRFCPWDDLRRRFPNLINADEVFGRHRYAQLKALEASFESSSNDKHLIEKQAEIERIEDAVSHIRFPLTFSDQVYTLRSHIDIVRRKIAARNSAAGRIAAE